MEYVQLISNQVFEDHRGFFAPLSLKYDDNIRDILKKNWLQSNISVNPKAGTLRGLHFQVGEFAQAKLIKVITGEIADFVVDIREDSPEYMKLHVFEMRPGDELIVPRGYAHGFITMDTNTVVQYLVDNVYSPQNEGVLSYKEIPELEKRIKYVFGGGLTIHDKDLITKNIEYGERIDN